MSIGIYVDLSHLKHLGKLDPLWAPREGQLQKFTQNLSSLLMNLVADEKQKVVSMYVYDAAPAPGPRGAPPSEYTLRRQAEFEVWASAGWTVRLGRCVSKKVGEERFYERRGVPVLMTLDLMRGEEDDIILVSGDSDLASVMECVVLDGGRFHLLADTQTLSEKLMQQADTVTSVKLVDPEVYVRST